MRSLRPRTLRGQLQLLIAIAVIASISFVAAALVGQRREALRRATDESLRLSQMAAAYDHQAVDGARQVLMSLSRTREITSLDGIESSRLFRALLRDGSAFAAVSAAAPDGRVFASSHAIQPGFSVARASWFARALASRRMIVGPFQRGAITGLPTFECAFAARDSQGVTRAVLFVDMDLENFSRLASELRLPAHASLVVLDRWGVVVNRWPDLHEWVGRRFLPAGAAQRILEKGEGTTQLRSVDGVDRIVGFTAIGDPTQRSLLVGVGMPRVQVLAAASRQLALSLLGLVLVGGLVLALVGRMLDSLVLRPVDALVRATRRVGRGDFEQRFGGLRLSGELAELARSFDAMTQRLRHHRVRHQRWAEAVRLSEQRKAAILEAALDAILTLDDEGRVLEFNPAAERIFGLRASDVMGRPVAELVLPPGSGRDAGRGRLQRALQIAPGRVLETTAVHADGTEFPVEIAVADAGTQDGHAIHTAFVRDISDRVRHEEALRSMSLIDPLSGLYNRRGFLTFAGQQLRLAERTGATVTLLFADLDGLKHINDTFGHAAGDRAIRDAAQLMRETFRDSDVIGRMGGDEFVVLTLDAGSTPPTRLLSRLEERVKSRNERPGGQPPLGFSAGVVQRGPKDRTTFSELLVRGDELMYAEKRAKKSGVVRAA